ncbi:MAG: DegT/DnrJ/EryC1/StrS family aminotransferase [Bacteroidales bacterium]|nr:DegT/DnrJ/EryC1/StrS family aminotransferase [Bacteroidales bacterium]
MKQQETSNNIQMVDLVGQYQRLESEIDDAIKKVLHSGAFIKGPFVKQFEENLAQYLNVKNVIACGNGTDALQIALMSLDLKAGDEIIVPSFTFIASAEVIALLGLKPVFADVDPDTFNIDTDQLEYLISGKTKAIIPVHLFGQPVNMKKITEIANKHSLWVIEDAAQATGADADVNGSTQKAGTIGHIGCTSFFPSKNLGTYGDGGAIFTNDGKLSEKIRMIANHGSHRKYYHDVVGVNSRLDAIHASILDVKLKHLDDFNRRRREAANRYDEKLKDIHGIQVPKKVEHGSHIFHQYTIKLDENIDRDQLKAKLQEKGIPSMVYYPVPMHLQNAFREHGINSECPVSEKLSKQVLSLPMHTELIKQQQDYITETLKYQIQSI